MTGSRRGFLDTEHRGLPRALVLLIGGACLVVILGGISLASWLIGPLFLALVIVIAINPVPQWLRDHGWPGWLATGCLVVLVYGLIAALAGVVIVSIGELAGLLPTYSEQANALVRQVTSWLAGFGVSPDQLHRAAGSIDFSKLVQYVGTLLDSLATVGTGVVFLLALLLFFSIDAGNGRLRHAAIAADRPALGNALLDFVTGTRRYLVVTTVFGLIVAALDVIGLWALGIPLALLWGVLSFITNYIPNIGFVLGVIPPALLGLFEGGWKLMIVVIAVYGVVNFLVQSVVQPRFVGNAAGLSTSATFVSLVLWSWLLGPLGSILAVPLSLLVKALLVDVDPRANWVEAWLGSKPPKAQEPGKDVQEKPQKPQKPEEPEAESGYEPAPT